jgi:hypothetical protein
MAFARRRRLAPPHLVVSDRLGLGIGWDEKNLSRFAP